MTNINSTTEHQGNNENAAEAPSLANCAPATSPPEAHRPATCPIIRRATQDEDFTTLADPVTLACIVDRQEDSWGNYTGEIYYPVSGTLQGNIGLPVRSVAFHPCITATGTTFIYPQKLDPPRSRVNSWNASLADALSHQPGHWRRIWSDSDAQRYQHDLVSARMEDTPAYPGFRDDLEQVLSPNIINSLDHPVIQRLLCQQGPDVDTEEVY